MKSLRQGYGGKTPTVPIAKRPEKSSQGAKRDLTGNHRKARFRLQTPFPFFVPRPAPLPITPRA